MEIILRSLGKKFSRRWVFKDLSEVISSGSKCAIIGYNGSGKSTLLQILSGARVASQGSVEYRMNHTKIAHERAFSLMNIAAPYIELVEELTLAEFFRFHNRFKQMKNQIDYHTFKNILEYSFRDDQVLKSFSSGMKQRIKLAFSVLSESSLILLDEPCSNLDEQGRSWYQRLIGEYVKNQTLIIASNDPFEYEMTDQRILLS